MAETPLRDRLEETFRFDGSDLDANRGGRVSPRQEARLRAARSGARLSLGVFVAVMLGSAAWVAIDAANALIVASVVLGSIAGGYLASRSSLAALGSRTVSVAEGRADADARGRLRLGGAKLALAAPELLGAFEPGAAYRVYYVAGPRALVLSAEALDERAPAAALPAGDPAPDPVLATARRARWVVLAIGVMAVEIPVVAIAARDLPPGGLLAVFFALVAQAAGFAVFAVRWLGRR